MEEQDRNEKKKRVKVVVFLDALDPRRTSGFLKDIQEGSYRCHFPCVTPTNMGSILTGQSPGKHGLVCPTMFEKPAVQKPHCETVIERVSKRMRVLSHGIPFTSGIHLEKGASGDGGGTGDEPVAVPALVFPRIPIDMGHIDPEKAFQAFADHASSLFATFRQFVRNGVADAYFVGFRNLDSFTHWHQEKDYYDRLQRHLGQELHAFLMMGDDIDLFVFSDHGSMPATGLFRLNLWLVEKGWLNVDVLWNKHRKRQESIKKSMPDREGYPDQIGVFAPYLDVTPDSRFVNADAFDACIDTVADDISENEVRELCNQLMETDCFDAVHTREDLYPGLTEEEYSRLPKIIPYRKPGVLVSSNLMPGLPLFGFTEHAEIMNRRNGDHWPEGYYGCTGHSMCCEDLEGPQALFGLIDEFCGEGPEEEVNDKKAYNEAEAGVVAEKLAELGYM